MTVRHKLWAAALLAAFFAQGLFLILRTSPTADETAFHMANGYAYLKTHDYRMSPANPALLREWMALPWLPLNPKLDLDKESWRQAESVPFSTEFLYHDNRAIADKLVFRSRFMILLLGAFLGLVILSWAGKLYGPWGGLSALAVYVFTPSFLGHAAIAHTDAGVSAFVCASGYFLWRYLESGKRRERFFFCLLFGFAAAAKFHALFFGVVYLAILGVRKGFGECLSAFWRLALISLLVIWASYFFDTQPLLAGGVPRLEQKLAVLPEGLRWAALHLPLPAPSYWLGLLGILKGHQEPYRHFAFGEWTTQSHWYFYFFSFAVKMTLPFLLLLCARAMTVRQCAKNANAAWVLLAPTALWFAVVCKDSTGVGVRYLFPVIPFLIVWVSGLATCSIRAFKIVGGGLLFWNTVAALAALPNNISYFNPLVAGKGWAYVRGSDVDWGQGLKELKRYLDKRGIEKVSLRYFGTAEPEFYGIVHDPLSDEELLAPGAKVYAISLFYLEHVQWTKNLPPPVIVGGSIAVYDFRT